MEAPNLVIWVLLAANLAALIVCLYWIAKLRHRFVKAFANLDSDQNLAETVIDYFEKLGITADKLDNLQRSYEHLAKLGNLSIQKTGIVRFNPFADTGSDQSFVLALLDNQDSGFLLTSIHGREGTRVYIKPIAYGASQHTLSKEEETALKVAKSPQLNQKEKQSDKDQA